MGDITITCALGDTCKVRVNKRCQGGDVRLRVLSDRSSNKQLGTSVGICGACRRREKNFFNLLREKASAAWFRLPDRWWDLCSNPKWASMKNKHLSKWAKNGSRAVCLDRQVTTAWLSDRNNTMVPHQRVQYSCTDQYRHQFLDCNVYPTP